jgi:hypothetical protein
MFCLPPSRTALIGLLMSASPAFAYHPLISDDTGTQGSGGNLIEVGFDYARSQEAGITDTSRTIPLTYTHGIEDNLDIFVGVSRQLNPATGWRNTLLGAKWRFYENPQNRFSLAIKPEILLPVSASREAAGLGNGEISFAMTFILTKETTFGELHLNLAAQRNNFDDHTNSDRRNLYRVSLAPVWHVSDNWKLAFDAGLTTNPDSGMKSHTGYMELGAIYSPDENLDFSLGLIRDSLGTSANSALATFLATWRFR